MISSSTLLSLLSSSINNTTLPSLTPTLTTASTPQAQKLLQIEAIKLIQISLDKLTSTKCVYKENLYKNLFISKILNKSKLYYYQSIVNTLRYTLLSKLTYLLNTNKNFKYTILNSSTTTTNTITTTTTTTTSSLCTPGTVEDDYINLIIKEAIDNLVNNNIDVNNNNNNSSVDTYDDMSTNTSNNLKRKYEINDAGHDNDDGVERTRSISTSNKRCKLTSNNFVYESLNVNQNIVDNNNNNIENQTNIINSTTSTTNTANESNKNYFNLNVQVAV